MSAKKRKPCVKKKKTALSKFDKAVKSEVNRQVRRLEPVGTIEKLRRAIRDLSSIGSERVEIHLSVGTHNAIWVSVMLQERLGIGSPPRGGAFPAFSFDGVKLVAIAGK